MRLLAVLGAHSGRGPVIVETQPCLRPPAKGVLENLDFTDAA